MHETRPLPPAFLLVLFLASCAPPIAPSSRSFQSPPDPQWTPPHLSSLEGSADPDEIDFEFLGHDKRAVQTNYYVGGNGGREQIHALPFDSSDGFHHYAIA
jgi:beta-glucanase (GH16 family)|uniref:GH16 domain-containing protein n=1 Tax=Zea mays TaxID=4577 RepID=A0A804NSY2_MAIZE